MKAICTVLLLISLLTVTVSYSAVDENYIQFNIESRSEIEVVTKIVSIDNVKDLTVFAYATGEQLIELGNLGYSYTILPHPGTLYTPRMSPTKGEQVWNYYPTYGEYVDSMYQFESDYPDLCKTYDIGSSMAGRSILYVKISDNVNLEEDEPEVMYTSTIHGNETTGFVLMLRLIDYLLENYGTDSLVTRLVDSCEIWINPLANPDGTYMAGNHTVAGAVRNNLNNVDLNRNFPDPEDGPNPDNNEWQLENIVMMNFAAEHTFVISANLHGGAEVLNYPWDTWKRLHPDDQWYIDICRTYADSAQFFSPAGYLTDRNNGITNGYDWYTISGGRQDYMNYWHGCREITLEISDTKLLPEDSLDDYWDYNRISLLNYLENALYGIRGVVTSSSSGLPLLATIKIDAYDTDIDSSRIFTDPDVGDYYRMLPAGAYDMIINSPGYYPDTINSITVADEASVRVDVQLDPLPLIPDLHFVSHSAIGISPGDDVVMDVQLENLGADDATNVLANLITDDPYVTIAQSLAGYPDIIALGGMENSNPDFTFTISEECPWSYLANFKLIVSADGGYLDTVTFFVDIGLYVEDFENGDLSNLPWQSGGDAEWFVATDNAYDGIYSAKSGDIDNSGYSLLTLSLEVIRAGTFSFHYRVSSESSDYFHFYVNSEDSGQWSGEVIWSKAEFQFDPGLYDLTWFYIKDASFSGGDDCVWIDSISFPALQSEIYVTSNDLPAWTAEYEYDYNLEVQNNIGLPTWSDRYNELDGTGLILSPPGHIAGEALSAGEYSFTANVTDQGGGEDEKLFYITINPPVEIMTDLLADGGAGSSYLTQLEASGGTGSLTWIDKNGDLESTGLVLSEDGWLGGIPLNPQMVMFTALVQDSIGASAEFEFSFEIRDLAYICGDANNDQSVNIGDAVHISYYIFKDGPAPIPEEAGNANCDDSVNIGDAVYLLNFIFKHGPPPCCP